MEKCGSTIMNNQYSFVNINLDSVTKNVNKTEDNRIISECVGNDIKIDLKEKIGAGTFGYIYSAMYSDNKSGFKKEVAVKKMVGKITSNNPSFKKSSSVLEDFEYEVEYSIDMANKGIGPHVYKAFYIIDKTTDENPIEEVPNFYVKYLILYIIMEKFEYSLDSFLNSGASTLQKETAVKMSMDLLKEQIYNSGLYCIDIKPGNYVVNLSNQDPVVKMIDFGSDYCKSSVNELRSKRCVLKDGSKDTLYVYCLLQLYEFLAGKDVSYIILTDRKFTEYFIKNRIANKDTIIQVYYEGSEQNGDQCHLVWFYGCVTMYYTYTKSLNIKDLYEELLKKEDNDELEDGESEDGESEDIIKLKLANDMYDILYHYIDKDIKNKNKEIDNKIIKVFKKSYDKTPNKSTVLKIRSKMRSSALTKRRNEKKL